MEGRPLCLHCFESLLKRLHKRGLRLYPGCKSYLEVGEAGQKHREREEKENFFNPGPSQSLEESCGTTLAHLVQVRQNCADRSVHAAILLVTMIPAIAVVQTLCNFRSLSAYSRFETHVLLIPSFFSFFALGFFQVFTFYLLVLFLLSYGSDATRLWNLYS